ncbi:MAG: Transglutaminase-like protein [Rhodocyclaceae bacterium]|nr:Transglutaminase-like protein [Rhodocyclaceae bacterium]
MRRRKFLAAAAGLLSLFGSDAWAARKKPAANAAARRGANKATRKGSRFHKPTGPVAHTAEDPVIESPPLGSSASRLPPVKAPEPPSEWRTYEITTTVTVNPGSGRTRLWLPLPLNQDTLFQRTLGHTWNDNADTASMRRLPDGNLEVYQCEWTDNAAPKLVLTTVVTTADRHFDVARRTVAPEREDILRRNLQASRLIPNDGLAHQLGERIVGRIKDPVAQAKAIYDWVVDNAIYDPSLPAGGSGNVRKQLDQGLYGGRSADINGLFVSLCRAIGIPARCVYGLRVGPSRLFRNLGLTSDDATRSQHVRAEFYVPGYGWIPVDPSDVRRAIALEGLSERDSKLAALRKILFGVWEMNWIAYNVGNDVPLPGSDTAIPFLLRPQVDTSAGRQDGTDTAAFQYSISVRQLGA